jgi:lysophospholipase L1-like esterase
MRNILFVSITSIIFFLSLDLIFGKSILNFLYTNKIILSEKENIRKIEKINKKEKFYRVQNSNYHHSLKANVKANSTWGKKKYFTCTDQFGFRQNCDEKSLSTKEKNIIIIGDSFTEGIGLNYEQTFGGMFSKKFNDKVLNMGVTSYSPVIYKTKIFHHINNNKFNIKHVVVFIDISDVDDEANNYTECKNKVCDRKNKNIIKNININKSEYSYKLPLYNLIKVAIKNLKRTIKPKIYIYRKDFIRSNWTFIEENQNIKIGIKNSIYHMNELHKYLKKRNITLSVGVYPHPGQILFDTENSKQVKIWGEFCVDKCKYFLNFFPIFFDELKGSSPKQVINKYYIKNDIHFNHLGNVKIYDRLETFNFN